MNTKHNRKAWKNPEIIFRETNDFFSDRFFSPQWCMQHRWIISFSLCLFFSLNSIWWFGMNKEWNEIACVHKWWLASSLSFFPASSRSFYYYFYNRLNLNCMHRRCVLELKFPIQFHLFTLFLYMWEMKISIDIKTFIINFIHYQQPHWHMFCRRSIQNYIEW